VEFHLTQLTVVASQTADSLNPDEAPDTWEVKGTDAILPMDLPMSSTWGTLRRAYGAAVGDRMPSVIVMFCKFPNMFFYLDADPESVGPIINNDLTKIPSESRIMRIIITLGPLGPWSCAGVQNPGS